MCFSKPTPVLAGDELQVNPGGARARGAGDTGSLPATCQTTVAGQDPKRSTVLQREPFLLSRCKPYPHHCSLIQPYSRAFAQNVLSLKIPLLPHPSLSPSNLDCWNSNPSTHLFSASVS